MDELTNVLVVDNEERICELIKNNLQDLPNIGTVAISYNGLSALQKIQNQTFELLIVDLVMKGKTGLELIDIIKKMPKFSRIKIILISGCLSKQHVHEAMNLGVKHILVKPFTRAKLLDKVKEVLK